MPSTLFRLARRSYYQLAKLQDIGAGVPGLAVFFLPLGLFFFLAGDLGVFFLLQLVSPRDKDVGFGMKRAENWGTDKGLGVWWEKKKSTVQYSTVQYKTVEQRQTEELNFLTHPLIAAVLTMMIVDLCTLPGW